MQIQLNWKSDILTNNYKIYQNNREIGFIKKDFFSQKANAEINGKKYIFKERGLFNQETDIIDEAGNNIVGEIRYNFWGNKASIEINDVKTSWEYTNLWNTQWSVTGDENLNIFFSKSSRNIESNTDDELQILSGLYVYNHFYSQLVIVMLVIIIPICIRNLSH